MQSLIPKNDALMCGSDLLCDKKAVMVGDRVACRPS